MAHRLAGEAQVTLFEAGPYFGGHTHTVDMTLDGVTHGVDTGFLVFNHRTYPNLVRLFETLGVETAPSEMSFSVQARAAGLEWSGTDLNGVFAQRRNLLRPALPGHAARDPALQPPGDAASPSAAPSRRWPSRSPLSWRATASATPSATGTSCR